jgi:integrase
MIKIKRCTTHKDRWMVEITLINPDGTVRHRERKKAPGTTKAEAMRWATDREAQLLASPTDRSGRVTEVPTLSEFVSVFERLHYPTAGRQGGLKASQISAIQSILRVHLLPRFGDTRLDQISMRDLKEFSASLLLGRSSKTVNNILSVLQTILLRAERWEYVPAGRLPKVELFRLAGPEMDYYEQHKLEQLIAGARAYSPVALAIVLLGSRAGLRAGEMLGLEWGDIDLTHREIRIRRNVWRGVIGLPKGGRSRTVPLVSELASALQAIRHERGERVFLALRGVSRPASIETLRHLVSCAERAAGFQGAREGRLHVLRHTFCSHLAMRGAPPKAIQELAGHTDLKVTLRYMHLSPQHRTAAIALLERDDSFGAIASPGALS